MAETKVVAVVDQKTGKTYPIGGGSSGGGTYSGTASIAVGGVKKGDSFVDADMQEMFDALLSPYTPPAVALNSVPATKLYKKGTTASGVKLSATVTKNSKAPTQLDFYQGSSIIKTITEGLESGGTFLSDVIPDFTTNQTFKATVTDGQGNTSSTITISFVLPFYNGTSSTAVVTSFIGMHEVLAAKGKQEVNYTADNMYLVFAYDSSYGNLTSIKDPNNFENLDAWTKSTKTIDGNSYNVYVTNTKITCTNFKYTFNF